MGGREVGRGDGGVEWVGGRCGVGEQGILI